MINIENNIASFKIQQSVNINFGDEQLVYDPIKGCRIDEHIYSKISSKGGILADEMGLGKTITSLSLISILQLKIIYFSMIKFILKQLC